MNSINIGISDKDREQIAKQLMRLQADTYTLYLQTHNFHWNVSGELFRELHLMFEEQYNELSLAVDEIAERIRTLGFHAPGTCQSFASLSAIDEVEGVPEAKQMISILNRSHETIVNTCRQTLIVAQQAQDESSIALISDRMRVHEKTAWMLRTLLD